MNFFLSRSCGSCSFFLCGGDLRPKQPPTEKEEEKEEERGYFCAASSQPSMVGKRNPDAKGEAGCFGGQGFCSVRSAPPFNSLLAACLLSVGSIASCVYLGMKTNDLQARVFAIEAAQGDMGAAAAAVAGSYRSLPSYSLDQLNSLMQEKVEQLLAQVRWP